MNVHAFYPVTFDLMAYPMISEVEALDPDNHEDQCQHPKLPVRDLIRSSIGFPFCRHPASRYLPPLAVGMVSAVGVHTPNLEAFLVFFAACDPSPFLFPSSPSISRARDHESLLFPASTVPVRVSQPHEADRAYHVDPSHQPLGSPSDHVL
jgi:hypothetical protein